MTHDDAQKIIGLLSSIHWWIIFIGVYQVVFRLTDAIRKDVFKK